MVRPITYGRLGNFLFQAACAMSYAWKHDLEFTLPDKTNDSKWNPIYLQHLVNLKWDPALTSVRLEERQFSFQEIPFKEEWRKGNLVLDGYWQTEKYFKDYRERLLEAFGYAWAPLKGFVSIHVRRTDYLRLIKKHPPVPKEWLERAMAQFPGFQFIFFSDDIAWCKEKFSVRKDCSFSEHRTEEADLIYMSACEHHICSASTFSWWGAWLNGNPNKRVIIPKPWFQPGHGGLDQKDIVPPEWTRL